MKCVLDTHLHTIASGHAYSTVTEYAREAADRGLELIAITDHAPKMPGTCGEFHFMNLKILPKELYGVRLLTGVELNIMDRFGRVDLRKGLLKRLDVVIASLHVPCIPPSTIDDNTAAVVNTMKNPLVRVIGHLGDPRYPLDIKSVVKTALETKTAIEINEVSMNPNNAVRSGGEIIVEEIMETCKREGASVIIGSDSHFHTYMAHFENAIALLEKINFPEELVLNTSTARFKEFMEIED